MVRVYGTFGRSDSRKGSRRRARGGVERDAGQLIDAGWRLYQRFYRVEWGNCTGSQGLPVPIGGILPSTHLGVVVNPQKAEALGVAVGPLEVIHQAPGHRGALAHQGHELRGIRTGPAKVQGGPVAVLARRLVRRVVEADHVTRVVVDAQHVQRALDRVQVSLTVSYTHLR